MTPLTWFAYGLHEAGARALLDGGATLNLVVDDERGDRLTALDIASRLTEGHELVALFRKRLQPIASEATKLKTPQLSILLANEALWGAVYMAGFPLAIIPLCGVPLFHALYWVA